MPEGRRANGNPSVKGQGRVEKQENRRVCAGGQESGFRPNVLQWMENPNFASMVVRDGAIAHLGLTSSIRLTQIFGASSSLRAGQAG